MKKYQFLCALPMTLLLSLFAGGCSKPAPVDHSPTPIAEHEHHAPHGGTAVVLGDEAYHLELVRDPADGQLRAYILDGEMENFVRCSMRAFEVVVTAGETAPAESGPNSHAAQTLLTMTAVANAATGETVGDTALFEAQAEWLKTSPVFEGEIKEITIRGSTFSHVRFNFPRGNER